MIVKAVIFDLDGVLVDTARFHFMAWKRLAAELGIELTEEMNEKLKGVGRMESLEQILKFGNRALAAEQKEELAQKKNAWFTEFITNMRSDELFEGVRPLFGDIRKAGLKLALASSSKNADAVLRQLNLKTEFDAIVDGTMISNSKPHPEIFLMAASKLKLKPETCIVVEDAEAGIEAAHAAGMKAIGVGSSTRLQKADLIVPHVRQIDLKQVLNLQLA